MEETAEQKVQSDIDTNCWIRGMGSINPEAVQKYSTEYSGVLVYYMFVIKFICVAGYGNQQMQQSALCERP